MTLYTRDLESCNAIRASARRDEQCAYRHCKELFHPVRANQRFCSQRCRKAYSYDLERAEAGIKGPRKKRLQAPVTASATPVAGSAQTGPFYASNSIACKQTQRRGFGVPRDVLGRGHRWPATPSIDRQVLVEILRREVCAP